MSRDLAELVSYPERIQELSRESVPALIGETEALKARLWARLQGPESPRGVSSTLSTGDHLLTASEAAERLGVNKRWIYRKADSLPFTRKLSGGTLRFSERGLERWKETRR